MPADVSVLNATEQHPHNAPRGKFHVMHIVPQLKNKR